MIPLIRLLGVCGVQGIVCLWQHGMRTRCHLLTFTCSFFCIFAALIGSKFKLNIMKKRRYFLSLSKKYCSSGLYRWSDNSCYAERTESLVMRWERWDRAIFSIVLMIRHHIQYTYRALAVGQSQPLLCIALPHIPFFC